MYRTPLPLVIYWSSSFCDIIQYLYKKEQKISADNIQPIKTTTMVITTPPPAPTPETRGTTRLFSDAFPDDTAKADTREMLNSQISKKSRQAYESHLIRFIIWLFDNRNNFSSGSCPFSAVVPSDFLASLEEGHARDEISLTVRGEKRKGRQHLRGAARHKVTHVDPLDLSTHPLILQKLNFDIMSDYFFSLTKPLTKLNDDGREVVDEMMRLRPTASYYDGISSALSFLFQVCKVPKDVNQDVKDMWPEMARYKKGSARIGAEQKQMFGIRKIGKDPLPLAAYVYLAEVLCKSQDPEYIAAHFFLLIDWNLISRADLVINANIELVGMWSDCLRFEIGKSKTDQEAKKHVDHPFHVYSCPENPAICPVFALGKHLIFKPHILNGRCKIFEGSNQYEHYCSILRRIVQDPDHRQALIGRGMNPDFFGTHSLRKG